MSLRLENEEKKPVLPEPERKANGEAVSCQLMAEVFRKAVNQRMRNTNLVLITVVVRTFPSQSAVCRYYARRSA